MSQVKTIIPPWRPDQAVALRQFIAGNPNFLPLLEQRICKCEGDTIEERAVTGSEAQGSRNTIQDVRDMAVDQPTEVRENGGTVPFEN